MSALLPDTALPAGLARASTPEEVGFGADRLQRLVDDGLLQIAAPVSRYLPALANLQVGVEVHGLNGERTLMLEPAAREITVQDLMRHTAGFTYGAFGDS